MKRIYYSDLADFVNLENINTKNKKVRKGQETLDYSKYDPNHGIIQSHLDALTDLTVLGKQTLLYPMGEEIKMMMFNLMLHAKGMLADSDPQKEVELKTNIALGEEFALYLDIEENPNEFSRIRISNYRKFELTGKPSERTKTIADFIDTTFKSIQRLYV